MKCAALSLCSNLHHDHHLTRRYRRNLRCLDAGANRFDIQRINRGRVSVPPMNLCRGAIGLGDFGDKIDCQARDNAISIGCIEGLNE